MRSILFFILITLSAFAANGQSAEALTNFNSGLELSKSGDHETALRCFTAALDAAKDDTRDRAFQARVNYNIGVSAYQLGKFEMAAERLETAIVLSGFKYEKAYFALGMTYAETGEWAEARDAFRHATALNEKNGEAWFDLAFAYLELDDRDMAMTAFARSIKYRTIDAPIAENNIGVLQAHRGNFRTAEKHFRNAIRLSGGAFTIAANNLNECRQMAMNNTEQPPATMLAMADRESGIRTKYE